MPTNLILIIIAVLCFLGAGILAFIGLRRIWKESLLILAKTCAALSNDVLENTEIFETVSDENLSDIYDYLNVGWYYYQNNKLLKTWLYFQRVYNIMTDVFDSAYCSNKMDLIKEEYKNGAIQKDNR